MYRRCFRLFVILLLSHFIVPCGLAATAEISGAGASFPAPVIQAWAKQFLQENRIDVRYLAVGSGEGIRRATARTVDFAMTDVPLTRAELVQDDLLQFPLVIGAIVPVINVPGIRSNELKLTGRLLGDIFLGKIASWDDEAIRALNPELSLPKLPIKVIHRSDGSGTTFVFTHYLSKVSAEWQERLGTGSRLEWPVGVGAKGNDGVSASLLSVNGAIGYVEYSYALKSQIAMVQLGNKAGRFVQPTTAGLRSALGSAKWSRQSYYEMLTDRDGEESWPLVGVSYVLVHRKQADAADAAETLAFMDWIFRRGGPLASALNYIAIEDRLLIERIESAWKDIRDEKGRPVWKGR